jgi:hypothetical protein
METIMNINTHSPANSTGSVMAYEGVLVQFNGFTGDIFVKPSFSYSNDMVKMVIEKFTKFIKVAEQRLSIHVAQIQRVQS